MYVRYTKRLLDLLFSVICLPLLLILFLPIAILIKLEDNGPIFYNSKRLGKNGKYFLMYKFRTMKVNSPDIRLPDGSTYNSLYDDRVTKIGRFLRESSLDEIPQFLNVIKGDMSLVGPRPDININKNYPDKSYNKLRIRPGITGFNQAYYRNETGWFEKLENDIYYINNLSFSFDLRILFKTILSVISRQKTYRINN